MKSHIELHVIDNGEPQEWLATCLDSIAPWPVRVLPADGRSIGESRAIAIRESSAEFVGWVDPDDYIDADQIAPMLDALERNARAAGAFSAETHIDAQGNVIRAPTIDPAPWNPVSQIASVRYAHNLTILRRAAALPHLDSIASHGPFAEYVLKGLATQYGPLLRVPVPAYYWRQHPAQAHRSGTKDQHAAALRVVTRPLMAHTAGWQRMKAQAVAIAHPARCVACRAASKLLQVL